MLSDILLRNSMNNSGHFLNALNTKIWIRITVIQGRPDVGPSTATDTGCGAYIQSHTGQDKNGPGGKVGSSVLEFFFFSLGGGKMGTLYMPLLVAAALGMSKGV